jgi:hypothetical protein
MTKHTNADGLEVRVKSPQRAQVLMHLHTLDELIRQDHPARAVWAYACTRDMSPWFAEIRAVAGGAGRDAVDPRILLALWLLATIEGSAAPGGSRSCASGTLPISGSAAR